MAAWNLEADASLLAHLSTMSWPSNGHPNCTSFRISFTLLENMQLSICASIDTAGTRFIHTDVQKAQEEILYWRRIQIWPLTQSFPSLRGFGSCRQHVVIGQGAKCVTHISREFFIVYLAICSSFHFPWIDLLQYKSQLKLWRIALLKDRFLLLKNSLAVRNVAGPVHWSILTCTTALPAPDAVGWEAILVQVANFLAPNGVISARRWRA